MRGIRFFSRKWLKKVVAHVVACSLLWHSFYCHGMHAFEHQQDACETQYVSEKPLLSNQTISLTDDLSSVVDLIRFVASLVESKYEAPLIFALLDQIDLGYTDVSQQVLLEAFEYEIPGILEKYHGTIEDDTLLQDVIGVYSQIYDIISSRYDYADSISRRIHPLKVFGNIYVRRSAEIATLYVDRDETVAGDLRVYGDLTVGGTTDLNDVTIHGVINPTTGNSLTVRTLRLIEDPANGTDAITLQAPSSLAASYGIVLPPNTGIASEVLTTDGFGNTFWAPAGGGGAVINGGNVVGSTMIIGTLNNFGLDFITNGLNRIEISNNGNVTIDAPGSGVGLTIAGGGLTSTGPTTFTSLGAGVMSTNGGGLVTSNSTTNHAVQVGNATNNLTSLAVGTDGQVLIGATGANPAFATLTSTGGTITFTAGPNSLDLETSGATANSFVTDSGIATPVAGVLNVKGVLGGSITTTGSGNNLDIKVAGTTNHAFQVGNSMGSLTSLPAATNGQIPIGSTGADPVVAVPTNGSNISWVTGAGSLQANVSGTTDHAVQVGNAGGSLTSLGLGTDGQVLLGATGANPSFVTPTAGAGLTLTSNATTLQYALDVPVTVPHGGTGGTSFTSGGVLYGNGVGALQVTAAGAANTVLLGNAGTPIFGAVPNGATTGTSANVPNTLVLRDGSGSFSTQAITLAAGTAAAPTLNFVGSTTTGLSAPTANTLVVSTNGAARMTFDSAGDVTVPGVILADGGVDVTEAGGTDTLNIGANNADIINIGTSATAQTINIGTGLAATAINVGGPNDTVTVSGTLVVVNTTNLDVTDKLITVNVGGLAGSGFDSGIQIEQGGSDDGYFKTDGTGTSWLVKAPNDTGIVTITPGAAGFVIDQGSHNPVTIGTANGLSITGSQVLSLQLANSVQNGALSSTDWNTFNNKAGSFATDVAGPVSPLASTLNVFGGSNITTDGSVANTVTIDLNPSVSVAGSLSAGTTVTAGTGLIATTGGLNVLAGGITSTGTTTLSSLSSGVMSTNGSGVVASNATTDNAVQIGNIAGNLTSLAVGNDGQVLIGATGAAPAFSTITSTGGTITFIANANSLNMETSGATANSFVTDSGTATPVAGVLNVNGLAGRNISTAGAGNNLTIAVSGTTNNALQIGNATGSLTSLGVATNGQIPIGSTGASPVLAVPTNGSNISWVTGAGSLTANVSGTTDHALQVGNAGGSLTSLGLGTAGQVLLSAGAGADPAFITPTAGTGLTLTSNATTLQYALSTPVTVANGGTGATSFTTNGLLYGNGVGAIQATAAGAANTVLLGTGAAPTFGQVPNGALANSSITLNNGNNITVTSSPVSLGGAATIAVTGTTQYAVQVGSAAGALTSVSPSPTAGVPLISNGAAANPSFGTAVVAGGGTGATSFTPYAVLCGGTTSTNPVQSIAGVGTAGQVLTSNGAGALPTFQSLASLNAYVQGGNSFGATGTLGLNDANILNIRTNSTTRISIDSAGAVSVSPATTGVTLAVTGNATSTAETITAGTGQTALALTGSTAPTVSITSNAAQNSIITSLGAVGTPAYSFIGDTNTGMYSPGADQVRLVTAGSDRLRIDASGNTTYTSNYKANVRFGANQTITGAGTATLQFNTVTYDPNGNFNTGTFLYTAPVTGYYFVAVNVSATYSNNNLRTLQLLRNGATVTGYSENMSGITSTRASGKSFTTIIDLTAGQTLGFQMVNAGGNVTMQANNTNMVIHFMSI